MKRKLLKQLVKASYSGSSLDAKKVLAISEKLRKRELKQYIRALRSDIQKKTVIVEVPSANIPFSRTDFDGMFEGKTVVTRTNPDLLLGFRIIDNDIIYDMNLRNRLNQIEAYASE